MKPGPRRERQHNNIVRIWEHLYKALVPQGKIRSIESQLDRPELLSGNRRIDEMQLKALSPIYITINDMVEYFRDGTGVRLTNEEDSVKIFDALMDHVSSWNSALRTSFNLDDAPVEDLILMEEFAVSVYDVAKFKIHEDHRGSLVRKLNSGYRHFGNLERTSVSTRQKPARLLQKTNADIHALKYEPDIETLQRVIINRSGNVERGY